MFRKILLTFLLAAPLAAQADNYFLFDGTNDRLTGTFTTQRADPITIFYWQYYTTHPVASKFQVQLGINSASNNDSYTCRLTNTDDEFAATSQDNAAAANSAFATKTGQDGVWVPVICEFISTTSRAVFAADATGTNATSRTVADTIDDIAVGGSLASGNFFSGRIAYVSVWNVQLSDTSETNLLAGSCPNTIEASNLIGYWPLQASGATQNNEGTDAGGDLTVDGATFTSTGGPGLSCGGGGAPTFSVAPSCSATSGGVSCTYTASATSTNYGVCVSPADLAPSCTQIKAGNNQAGTAAWWAGSDANTGTSDTIVVTGSNKPVKADCYFCLNNGGGDSAVDSSQTDKLRSPRSGFLTAVMSGHSSTGLCNLDPYFNPDCADGDVIEYEDDTDENANCNILVETDGDMVWTPTSAGDCGAPGDRRSSNASWQDSSATGAGTFTAPTVGNFVTDDTVYLHNSLPNCDQDVDNDKVLLTKDAAMTTTDMVFLGSCFDADSDVLTFSVTGGSLPTGTSLGGTGNKDWTGTPTVENETGTLVTITATDVAGETGAFDFTVYVTDNSVTTPAVVGDTVAEAVVELDAVRPWQSNEEYVTATFAYSGVVAAGDIISQNPTTPSTMTASQILQVVVSLGVAPAASSNRARLGLGIGIP